MSGSIGKSIQKPAKSNDLAEFVGIMMGDGGMSKYQATITLHHIDDLAYSKYVVQIVRKLFAISPTVTHRAEDSANVIVMSRIKLVDYLHELGLPVGNKVQQGLDIPPWIKRSCAYSIACIRGLVDTDGSIFTHRYRVKGTWYAYKKLSFTSASPALVSSVYKILIKLKFHARISRNGKEVRLDSIADMKRYFSLIGTHNPKHLKRYEIRVG